jgi:hypothetical protein
MKKIIPFILLIFALNSCGKAISKIAIDDRKEHIQTLQLNEGDKIKFWSKIKYKSESELDLQYSVQIFKNGELYTTYMYSPLKTNPRYLSSDERWIVSRKRNPDWIKPPGFVFNLLKFKWVREEDERYDFQKGKHIYEYGIKKNVKGKNTPVFIVPETGNYTFKAQLNAKNDSKTFIKRAEIILRK